MPTPIRYELVFALTSLSWGSHALSCVVRWHVTSVGKTSLPCRRSSLTFTTPPYRQAAQLSSVPSGSLSEQTDRDTTKSLRCSARGTVETFALTSNKTRIEYNALIQRHLAPVSRVAGGWCRSWRCCQIKLARVDSGRSVGCKTPGYAERSLVTVTWPVRPSTCSSCLL